MKKRILLAVVFIFLMNLPSQAFAAVYKPNMAPLKKLGNVMGRGALNVLASPWEFVRTSQEEKDFHPRAWPLTALPMSFHHMLVRIGSGVADILCYSWVAPFNEIMTPLTQHFSLPEYPWQKL